MLTEKEVKALPAGEYPNHVLRMKYGDKHGTPVKMQYTTTKVDPVTKEKSEEIKETTIIGNRTQKRFRVRNPLADLPDYSKPKFQSSRLDKKSKVDKSASVITKIMNWIQRFLFSRTEPTPA